MTADKATFRLQQLSDHKTYPSYDQWPSYRLHSIHSTHSINVHNSISVELPSHSTIKAQAASFAVTRVRVVLSTRYFRPSRRSLKSLIVYAPGTNDPLNRESKQRRGLPPLAQTVRH
jgi:hypothetical protein